MVGHRPVLARVPQPLQGDPVLSACALLLSRPSGLIWSDHHFGHIASLQLDIRASPNIRVDRVLLRLLAAEFPPTRYSGLA